MLKTDFNLSPKDLRKTLSAFWEISEQKIYSIHKNYDSSRGAPVFTVGGKYTTRGWTEWTQGFQFGSQILQFDATDQWEMLEIGRQNTVHLMAPHLSHFGVHDHGFNNLSTYGNLLRLMNEKRIPESEWERNFYELALKISGAVQARRWTKIKDGGYIYSFNGPHSLFVDTIRTCRILGVSYKLGHRMQGENDQVINLLERLLQHLRSTTKYAVFYGEGRDIYDVRGRTAHESIFNTNDGNYRSPGTQQGYSPFSTWTRGLAWAMCGLAEELEFLATLSDDELDPFGGRLPINDFMLKAATATCDFYIENTPSDGIPYWDSGAPNLHKLGNYLDRPSDPFNDFEPVDSSAAAIAAQALLRLGKYLKSTKNEKDGQKYFQAGLTVLKNLLAEPYLSTGTGHQGLILHSIYHRPNCWDYQPEGSRIPNGESSMWGDYHAREAALYVQRLIENKPYLTFFGCCKTD